jgi:AraC family transcriptional regulator
MIKKDLINQSIDYIIQHCDENLTVEDVADHFHFSKYYFSRSFKEVTGESVYEFIKRLKMDQSAIDIKLGKKKAITDIGLDYGYSSSNYSSAFKKHHRVSPMEFRKISDVTEMQNPFYAEGQKTFQTYGEYNQNVQILELPDFHVVYQRIIGNYITLKEQWRDFADQYRDYVNEDTLFIERFYDDPAITNLNSCICDICMTINEDNNLHNATTIKGGKFASYRFEGRIADIFCTIQGIFSVWLPASGYELDKRYGLNIYRSISNDEDGVTMDLCISIK